MPEFVRVRLENGSEASVSAEFAKHCGLEPLKKPAAQNGVALPAKHNPIKPATPLPAPVADIKEKPE